MWFLGSKSCSTGHVERAISEWKWSDKLFMCDRSEASVRLLVFTRARKCDKRSPLLAVHACRHNTNWIDKHKCWFLLCHLSHRGFRVPSHQTHTDTPCFLGDAFLPSCLICSNWNAVGCAVPPSHSSTNTDAVRVIRHLMRTATATSTYWSESSQSTEVHPNTTTQ